MSTSRLGSESPNVAFSNDEDEPIDMPRNGLSIQGPPFGLEKVNQYGTHGHHPAHIGDFLGDGRYKIIHKLGHGGFANVWFCRDTHSKESTRYVALKILAASVSTPDCGELLVNKLKDHTSSGKTEPGTEYICLHSDCFMINGPNGSHHCFVYPVLGPKVTSGALQAFPKLSEVLRSIAFRTVQAMGFLHSHGICHGGKFPLISSIFRTLTPVLDFTPSNVLLQMTGFDGLPEEELIRIIGEPQRAAVIVSKTGEAPTDPSHPRYLVFPVTWKSVDLKFYTDKPCVIDFGESFEVSKPHKDLGIPGPYRSPELILERKVGIPSDLWTLGCTIFEIRTGRKIFNLFDDEDDDYIDAMVWLLGKLPEPWWSTTWKARKEILKDEVDGNGRALLVNDYEVVHDPNSRVHPSVAEDARSLMESLGPGLWYLDDDFKRFHEEIDEKEKVVFADLVGKLLRFDPGERVSAKDALGHEWFQSVRI